MSVQSGAVTMARGRGGTRLATVAATVSAAEVLWVLLDVMVGIDLRSPAFEGVGRTPDIGPLEVALASGAASLAAWGLLAAMERMVRRARTFWSAAAVLAFVGSLGGPLSGTGITAANRAGLVVLHLAVAALLIPGLYRTSPAPASH